MVYDVTNTASFDNLEDWHSVVQKIISCAKTSSAGAVAQSSIKPHFALVANKSWYTVLFSSRYHIL